MPWHLHQPNRPLFLTAAQARASIHQQDAIGWHQFSLGRLSKSFAEMQDTYLKSLNKQQTGLRWTQALIQKLWDIAWDLWEFRNQIKNNTITPQHQWALKKVGLLLKHEQTLGITGLRRKDIHLINTIDSTLLKPLAIQQRRLDTIKLARMAGLAFTTTQDAALIAQQTRFRRFFI